MTPRPLFLYGTLMAPSFLAWCLLGDPEKVDVVASITAQARLRGPYVRTSLHGADYPALVRESECPEGSHATEDIIGILVFPRSSSERKKLDDFEGEMYEPTAVDVINESTGHCTNVDVYIWAGDRDRITGRPWDFDAFVRDRLPDWLEIFGGMEMVGIAE